MSGPYDLERFVAAQAPVFDAALSELHAGSKRSHWMWFIFPQLRGLGRSAMSDFYGLASLAEARAYLDHELLGPRLRQCIAALLSWAGRRTPEQILGGVDALKLRSCLTLFDRVEPRGPFGQALGAMFNGQVDERTLAMLKAEE